jgi:5-methylcytosine-specific restriction endonuclease McrA
MSDNDSELIESTDYDEPYHNPDWLRQKYIEEDLSTIEIAEVVDVTPPAVIHWMEKHGIDRGGPNPEGGRSPECDLQERGGWLREMYWSKWKTVAEIAEVGGYTESTVRRWMEKHGIERRDRSKSRVSTPELLDANKLRSWNHDDGLTLTEISDKLGCSKMTVSMWFDRHGIEIEYLSGEDHPSWKGGYDGYYGKSWHRNRKRAIERDGGECVICGVDDRIEVHHITPFRKFGLDNEVEANQLDNLITLCPDCHGRWEGIELRPQIE